MLNKIKNSAAVMVIALMGIILISAAPVYSANAKNLKKHPAANKHSENYIKGNVLIKMKKGCVIHDLKGIISALPAKGRARTVPLDNIKKFRELSSKTGMEYLLFHSPAHSTKELIELFGKSPLVEIVEPDYIMHINQVFPDDEYFDQLWGLHNTGQEINETTGLADADIDAPEAWERSTGSADVIAAVLDTGVDYTHADLQENMWVNQIEADGLQGVDDDENGYVDDIYGIDTYNEDSDPYDDNSHGTHVAGTISAHGNNESGIAGVTWNTRIMALKFLSGKGSGPVSAAIECMDYIIALKERGENIVVVNTSWGSSSNSELLNNAISAAADTGIIISAAAGNSSRDTDGAKPLYPAASNLSSIVAVAATNQDDELAYFSNYGASVTDLAAPGVNILSAVPGGGYEPGFFDFFYDDMESGCDNWDMDATDAPWGITEEHPYEDAHSWSDSPDGNYHSGAPGQIYNYSLVSRSFDLSEQTGNLMLGFWLWNDILPDAAPCGARDTLYIEISPDDGETWASLGQIYGKDLSWKLYSYLIPEADRTAFFRFRFRFESWPTGNSDGIYIDNVGIGLGSGMGSFKYFRGTSMAAPHVTGAISLDAALYPFDDIYTRINRILSGVEKIESMSGIVSTDGRLNLDLATDPDLAMCPFITGFEEVDNRIIEIAGKFFGDEQDKILFHDKYDLNNTIQGIIQSWSDTEIRVIKPKYSGDYYWVENAAGLKSSRKQYRFSMWEQMAEASAERDSAAATALNGKIYVFGGYAGGNDSLRSWEWYTPEDNTWHHIFGNWMQERRAHLTSASLNDKIFIIGGYSTITDECLDTVTIFDPDNNNFTYAASLPVAMCFMRAAALDGKIYLTGGLDNDDNPLSTLYEYDPVGNTWTQKASMPVSRFEHGTVAVNGKIYAFGGLEAWEDENIFHTSGEIYDPATNIWSPMADMPVGLARFGAAADGRYIYVAGGTNDDFWYTHLDIVLRYDTQTNTWISLAERMLLTPKVAAPAVYLNEYGLYSINGGHYSEESGPFGHYYEGMKELEFLGFDKLTDADGDSIPDTDDNCCLTYNPGQQDTDSDGYGNICDCDLDNDDAVGPSDFGLFKSAWSSTPGNPEWNPNADFDVNGAVGPSDFGIFKQRWGNSAPFE